MGQTIIGDVYSVAERARVTGYVAGVWAASSVIGPTLGGVFSDYVSWRWIFFVNIPVAIAAMLVLHRSFHESVERKRHRIDYTGAALLAVGASMLILGLLEGGVAWAWDSRPASPCCRLRRAAARSSGTSSRAPPSPSCRCGSSAAGC